MNDARQISLYSDVDCEALTDVIVDYYTSRYLSDTRSCVMIATTKLVLLSASVLTTFLSKAVTSTKILIVMLILNCVLIMFQCKTFLSLTTVQLWWCYALQQVHYQPIPCSLDQCILRRLRKCAIFSVACEALSKQVRFLIDESVQCGKTQLSQLISTRTTNEINFQMAKEKMDPSPNRRNSKTTIIYCLPTSQ